MGFLDRFRRIWSNRESEGPRAATAVPPANPPANPPPTPVVASDEPGRAALPLRAPDDLSVPLPPRFTVEHLVDHELRAREAGSHWRSRVRSLAEEFGLSFDHARRVVDRVGGGLVRASTAHDWNRPNPRKDPVAHAAYQRARGAPAPAPPHPDVSPAWALLLARIRGRGWSEALPSLAPSQMADHEAFALDLWMDPSARKDAFSSPGMSVRVALRFLDLTEATLLHDPENPRAQSMLPGTGYLLRIFVERCITAHTGLPYIEEGSPAWYDLVTLSQALVRLRQLFALTDDADGLQSALGLRGALVTRGVPQCFERVAEVMRDAACAALAEDRPEEARRLCSNVFQDFQNKLAACEAGEEILLEEDEVALRLLQTMEQLYLEAGGAQTPEFVTQRSRCAALLARHDAELAAADACAGSP